MRWIRSAAGDLRYVGWGPAPRKLAPHLNYLTGSRGILEQMALRSGLTASGKQRAVPHDAEAALAEVMATVEPRQRGLLLYTGYYKDSWFVGPVATGTGIDFLKVFRDPHQASEEIRHATLAARLPGAGARYLCLPATPLTDRAVSYPIVRRRGRASTDTAIGIAMAISRGDAPVSVDEGDWAARADAVEARVLAVGQSPMRPGQLASQAASGGALTLSHGDLTPWNIIPTGRGPVLIDYERLGWRPRHFDLIYAVTHVPAVAGREASIPALLDRLKQVGVVNDERRATAVSALAVGLVEHGEALLRHPNNTRRVEQLVRLKSNLLRKLTDD